MKRMRFGIAAMRFALVFSVVLCGAMTRAHADVLIASDSYVTGTNPGAGQYVAGNGLKTQPGLVTPGFANGAYASGSGTSNFVASSTGLASTADGASATGSGSVAWVGAANDNAVRSVARNLSTFNEASSGTYFMSMLVSNTGNQTTTSGYVLSGFGNATVPALGTTTGNLFGIYFGFADDSGTPNEADLVLRYRNTANPTSADQVMVNGANNATAGQTYLVVAEVNINVSGTPNDQVTYWVNPTDLNSVADMNATAIATNTLNTFAFQGTGDFTRLTYSAQNWDGDATFDEQRLGTTLASIAPVAVPEPSSMILLGAGSIAALAVRSRRRARVQS
jgi:PEP-CTERM motif